MKLNDQVYNNVKLNVSYARPRQSTFNRKPFVRNKSVDEHSDTLNWADTGNSQV
jgi:hypothetical protein